MSKDEWYVILNMNCKYEICRMCPKSGLFKGTHEECEKWIKQKQKEEKIEAKLKQEAEEYANNLLFVFETDVVQKIVRERVKLALIDVLETREKQIQIDAEQIRALQKQNGELTDKVKELEAQIEKLIDFVLSKIECCDVCPLTDTCINSEGTCPYAGILAKGEEEVTREWLMQFISKEIKEK